MIDTVGMVTNVGCMMATITLGIVFLGVGLAEKEKESIIFGLLLIIVGFVATVENPYDNSQYIPAEPFAHNQTQTVFTTDEGTYIADGLYPDGTYLLIVDGKDVLVVWQAVKGEEVGLG